MAVAIPHAGAGRTTVEECDGTLAPHGMVAEAIAACDPARARAAMDRHFDNSIGKMLKDPF